MDGTGMVVIPEKDLASSLAFCLQNDRLGSSTQLPLPGSIAAGCLSVIVAVIPPMLFSLFPSTAASIPVDEEALRCCPQTA